MREDQVRFGERLGVKFSGLLGKTQMPSSALACQLPPVTDKSAPVLARSARACQAKHSASLGVRTLGTTATECHVPPKAESDEQS